MFGKQRAKSLDKIKVIFKRKSKKGEEKSIADADSPLDEISIGAGDEMADHFNRNNLKQSVQKFFRSFRRTSKANKNERNRSIASLTDLETRGLGSEFGSNSKSEAYPSNMEAAGVQNSAEENAEDGVISDSESTKMDMCLVCSHSPIGEPSVLPVVNGATASLTQELAKLVKYGWYWGPISRSEAVEKLSGHCDGAFLLRDSSDDHYLLSLSFRSFGRTFHTRIEHTNGLFSFSSQPELEAYTSVVSLIEESIKRSEVGVFCYSRGRSPGSPSIPVRLTKPVSRFTQVRSLQYLCRFVIRQYIRYDHIQKLPLPQRIKGYLEEGHY